MEEQLPEKDEISLRDLILNIVDLIYEVKRSWKTLFLICSLFVFYYAYKAYTEKGIYSANISFMLNDEGASSPLAAASGILSSFIGGSADHNFQKIIDLSRSYKVLGPVLLEKANINGIDDYIANHLIREYEYHEDWVEDTTGFKDFYFTHDNLDSLNLIEGAVFKALHGQIVGNPDEGVDGLLTSSYGESSGILNLSLNSTSEKISLILIRRIFDSLREFYVGQEIEKQLNTYEILKYKSDSLETQLDIAQNRYLRFEDSNLGLTRKRYEAQKFQLLRDLEVNKVVFTEVKKNMEIANFALHDATPYIQPIDFPFPPLDESKRSIIVAIILGGILGTFVSVVFILARYFFRKLDLGSYLQKKENEELVVEENSL